MKTILRGASFILTVFFAGSLFASFAETHGFSASGIARGNAVTATVNDWSSVFYNIAGLGRTRTGLSVEKQQAPALMLKKGAADENAAAEEKAYLNDQIGLNFFYTMPSMKIDIPRKDVKAAENLNYGIATLGLVLDLNHFYRMPKFISSARFGLGLGTMMDGSDR